MMAFFRHFQVAMGFLSALGLVCALAVDNQGAVVGFSASVASAALFLWFTRDGPA